MLEFDLVDDFEDEELFGEDFEDFEDIDGLEDGDDIFSPEDIAEMESLAEDFAEGYEDIDSEDAFLGALAGLAAKALPVAMKAAPMLLNAGRAVMGRLSRSTTVRNAARAVPHIMRRTAADQLRRYSRGQRVSRTTTLRSAARHTANAMDPRRRRRIIRNHRVYVRRRPTPTRRSPHMGRRIRRVCRWVRY
ncbi:MAG: hypothetical protein AAF762_09450 [Pseudomonadota bacterium]